MIILALDQTPESEKALPVAAWWARRAGVSLELVMVSSPGLPEGPDLAYLERRAAQLEGVSTTCRVLKSNGPVEEAVLDEAGGSDALVCLATHARGPVGELFMGSVSEALIRKAFRAVLLVGPEVDSSVVETGEQMLICLDGSVQAEAILPVALHWAPKLGLRPWLLEVVKSADDAAGEDCSYVHQVAERLEADGVPVDCDVLLGGDSARLIVEFARESSAAVIAMTSHARAGIRRLRFPSVAIDVTGNAPCPVLVFHPHD